MSPLHTVTRVIFGEQTLATDTQVGDSVDYLTFSTPEWTANGRRSNMTVVVEVLDQMQDIVGRQITLLSEQFVYNPPEIDYVAVSYVGNFEKITLNLKGKNLGGPAEEVKAVLCMSNASSGIESYLSAMTAQMTSSCSPNVCAACAELDFT